MDKLVIAEKPKVAKRIAHSLSNDVEKKRSKKVNYYIVQKDGEEIVVSPAVGHLYTLKNKDAINDYPYFDIDWVPTPKANSEMKYVYNYINKMKDLSDGVDEYIIACDYDLEGEVIGYNALRFSCEGSLKQTKRMKFSSLTEEEVNEAWEEMSTPDLSRIDAGILRHELDWFWGMNISTALSSSYKAYREQGFAKLSSGRVQGPTLKFLVDREKEIEEFDPTPYWELFAVLKNGVEAKYEDKLWDEEKANNIISDVDDNIEVSNIKERKYSKKPPYPFNLGDLQSAAYNNFNYSPKKTQSIAQDLYEAGLISYPRTSSQKLPKDFNKSKVLKKISNIKNYQEIVEKLMKGNLKPNEGKKSDPAHPCIYPTGEKPKNLSKEQGKIYDMVTRRFLAIFDEKAVRKSTKVTLGKEHNFIARGRKTIKKGWLSIYGRYKNMKTIELPDMEKGTLIPLEEIRKEEKETKPPSRYTPSSAVNKMEDLEIGTKATRANIIDKLYDRNYISKKSINVTQLGRKVVEALEEYSPEILSPELTSKFEKEIKKVRDGEMKKNKVLEESKEELKKILEKIRENEKEIGKTLSKAVKEARRNKRTLGSCPDCGEDLIWIRSKKTGKRFVICTNEDCDISYPLPQDGKIYSTKKTCDECNTPKIKVRGKKNFQMCLDPDCPTKDDWN